MQRMECGGVQLEALMELCGFHPCNWRKFLATMEVVYPMCFGVEEYMMHQTCMVINSGTNVNPGIMV